MPFEQFTVRSLTPVSVRTNAPSASGVYGICNAREWIYVGESDNIRASLLAELQRRDSAILRRRPTGFVSEVCSPAERGARQLQLIDHYRPVCNGRSQMGIGASE